MNKSNAVNRILLLFLALPAALLLVFAYQQLAPVHPIEIHRVRIITTEAKAGDPLTYEFEYCQTSKTAPVVYRKLVPENLNNIITIPAVLGVVREGCHTNSIVLPLPMGMQPGKYRLEGVLVFSINNFRTAQFTYTTENTVTIK